MTTTQQSQPSRTKILIVYIVTVILGYILFILPDIFFGVTKINGGKVGINLLFISLFQFIAICALLHFSLKAVRKNWRDIGLNFHHFKKDFLLGLLFAGLWTALQFLYLIPATGGESRADVSGMLTMYDGSILGTISFVALGVIGGGITEEIFNRGYFITILASVFKNPTLGLYVASLLSILIFCVGHLPTDALQWFDILVPTLIYTFLFLYTKRLTASIVAHGVYNLSAILLVYHFYY